MAPNIRIAEFYDLNPDARPAIGDIYIGVPEVGTLCSDTVRAIVVTPACDLDNQKLDAVTVVPIVSIPQYFSSRPAVGLILGTLQSLLGTLQIQTSSARVRENRFDDLERGIREIRDAASGVDVASLGTNGKKAMHRLQHGLALLEMIDSSVLGSPAVTVLKEFFDAEWPRLLERLFRNALDEDLYFLPCDQQQEAYSGMPQHSVALLRHGFPIPWIVLQLASNIELQGDKWIRKLERLAHRYPYATRFITQRPEKRIRLQPPFLTELMSRRSAVNSREGSPDFSSDDLARMAGDLERS